MRRKRCREPCNCARRKWARLEVIRYQHPTVRAKCGLTILSLDATDHVYYFPVQFDVRRDLHDQPFEHNGLIGIDRTAEANSKLQADHGSALGEV